MQSKIKFMHDWQTMVGSQNEFVGWRDGPPRSFSRSIGLIHEEVSEALTGLRKNAMDDHLPKYPMMAVEFIDVIIRCLDYLDLVKYRWGDMQGAHFMTVKPDMEDNINNMHMLLSEAWLHNGSEISKYQVQRCAMLAYDCLVAEGYDVEVLMNEKMEYNLLRSDHQRENRQGKPGQKAW